jgi:hypothetical protein
MENFVRGLHPVHYENVFRVMERPDAHPHANYFLQRSPLQLFPYFLFRNTAEEITKAPPKIFRSREPLRQLLAEQGLAALREVLENGPRRPDRQWMRGR